MIFFKDEFVIDRKKELENFGIIAISVKDNPQEFEEVMSKQSDLGFYFFVIDKDLNNILNFLCKNSNLITTKRILPFENVKNLIEKSPDDIVLSLYKEWAKFHLRDCERDIQIYFDDAEKIKSWEQAYKNLNQNDSANGRKISLSYKSDELKKIKIGRHWFLKNALENFSPEQLNDIKYLDCTSYSNSFFSFLYSIDPNNIFLREFVLWQIWEMGNSSVVVLDERVADSLAGNFDQMERLFRMGIKVINRLTINNNVVWESKNNFEKCLHLDLKNNLEIQFNNVTFTQLYKPDFFDFLFIHQARFNELFQYKEVEKVISSMNSSMGVNENLKVLMLNYLNSKFKWIILHSGRGYMKKEILPNSYFLEFSIIQDNLIREPNKYDLLQAAFAAI